MFEIIFAFDKCVVEYDNHDLSGDVALAGASSQSSLGGKVKFSE